MPEFLFGAQSHRSAPVNILKSLLAETGEGEFDRQKRAAAVRVDHGVALDDFHGDYVVLQGVGHHFTHAAFVDFTHSEGFHAELLDEFLFAGVRT